MTVATRRNLVLSGGPGHDFAATSSLVTSLLDADGLESVVVDDPDVALDLLADPAQRWDLLTVNALRWRMRAERYADQRADWAFTLDPAREQIVLDHVRAGGGLLALHTAVICFDASPGWHRLTGASWNWERSSHPPLGDVAVRITAAGAGHPVTADARDFTVTDEAYGFLDEDPDLVPLATTSHGGREHPVVWAREAGDGRVVTDLLGHGVESMSNEAHADVLRAAARWATRGER